METEMQEIGQYMDPLEAHRKDLVRMAALFDTMPSLKKVDEHWDYYIQWKICRGLDEPVPLTLKEALSVHPEKHLAEFFQFWLDIQRAYLAALTYEDETVIKGLFDENWRDEDQDETDGGVLIFSDDHSAGARTKRIMPSRSKVTWSLSTPLGENERHLFAATLPQASRSMIHSTSGAGTKRLSRTDHGLRKEHSDGSPLRYALPLE